MECWGLRLVCLAAALLYPLSARAQQIADPNLNLEVIADNLEFPTTMAFVSATQLLYLERISGKVRLIENGMLQSTEALDVNVNAIAERGLLGIAVNTETPPVVFLFYTEANGTDGGTPLGNRVYRYTWNPATRSLDSPLLLLDLPVGMTVFNASHNAGVLTLGAPGVVPGVGDGALLHVVIGDLNRNGQLQNNAAGALPDDSGVILRILQDGEPAPGNPLLPFCSSDPSLACEADTECGGGSCQLAVSRYFAYGIRNGFGLAVDPGTGWLWDTENGPMEYDEVNLVAGGMNSGWRKIMGPMSRDPEGVSDLFAIPGSHYDDPELSFLTPIGITAIVFLDGSTLGASYDGRVLIGETNQEQLYLLPLNRTRTGFDFSANPSLQDLVVDDALEDDPLILGSSFGVVTDLELGPDGNLYILSYSQGKLFRLSGPRPVSLMPRASLLLLGALSLGLGLGWGKRLRAASGRAIPRRRARRDGGRPRPGPR